MKVTYEDREYEFDLDEIDVDQAQLIYSKTGLTIITLEAGLEEMNPFALKAVFWLMLVQNGEKADFDRVNFKLAKFLSALMDANKAKQEAEKAAATPKKRGASRASSQA